jgi:ABC-type transporter Mla maintaining outer membrane lipid asymmetry ATPase subunit MlaF
VTPVVLELIDVVKDYRGLRPLRIRQLRLAAGDSAAIVGVDQPMAETFVNLVTGATLPDRGEVRAFGQLTSLVNDSTEWLALVDRYGIVSERAVLLGELSVIQNLAMPFTLEIEPPPEDVRVRAEQLALEVGLPEASWPRPVAELDAAGRMRVRFARALALDPAVLLLEHPTAGIPREGTLAFGRSIRDVAERRGVATLTLTADRDLASAIAKRVLVLDAASGLLKEPRVGWLARRLG